MQTSPLTACPAIPGSCFTRMLCTLHEDTLLAAYLTCVSPHMRHAGMPCSLSAW